ncbi:hypothetical protein B0H13DRAFT_2651749 [Mycena leptocephala]|nr:hypothetical protein B0H13DRAFT_2651749 [Mycena leptocephala]
MSKEIKILRLYMKSLPEALPYEQPEHKINNLLSFSLDRDAFWEFRGGRRNDRTFKIPTRGPAIEKLADILEYWLEKYPTALGLQKWIKDATASASAVILAHKQLLPISEVPSGQTVKPIGGKQATLTGGMVPSKKKPKKKASGTVADAEPSVKKPDAKSNVDTSDPSRDPANEDEDGRKGGRKMDPLLLEISKAWRTSTRSIEEKAKEDPGLLDRLTDKFGLTSKRPRDNPEPGSSAAADTPPLKRAKVSVATVTPKLLAQYQTEGRKILAQKVNNALVELADGGKLTKKKFISVHVTTVHRQSFCVDLDDVSRLSQTGEYFAELFTKRLSTITPYYHQHHPTDAPVATDLVDGPLGVLAAVDAMSHARLRMTPRPGSLGDSLYALVRPFSPLSSTSAVMDITPDHDTNSNTNPAHPPGNPKDFLVGPKTNVLPVHGWTNASVLFNHLEENVNKVMDKPSACQALTLQQPQVSSLAAVIIGRDRPADRAMGADAIADAIVNVGLATQAEFTVIPLTPNDGAPDAPILPHTNLILCNSSQLKDKIVADPTKVTNTLNCSTSLIFPQAIVHTRRMDETDGFTFYIFPVFPDPSWYIGTYVGLSDRLTCTEFISALFEKLITDREAIKLIQEHHDRVPEAHDIPFAVWMPTRRGSTAQRQNTVRLYMPPPSLQDDTIKAWKEHPMPPPPPPPSTAAAATLPSSPHARHSPASTRTSAARTRPWMIPLARPTTLVRPSRFLGPGLSWYTRCAVFGSLLPLCFHTRSRRPYLPIDTSPRSTTYACTPTSVYRSLAVPARLLRRVWFPPASPTSAPAPAARTCPSTPPHARTHAFPHLPPILVS